MGEINLKELRLAMGMSQSQFWHPLGVSQSAGSKFERGRKLPKVVKNLVNLVHIEKVDISKITKDDQYVAEYLKEKEPEMYKALQHVARLHFTRG